MRERVQILDCISGTLHGYRLAASVVSPVLSTPAFLCRDQEYTTSFCACVPLWPDCLFNAVCPVGRPVAWLSAPLTWAGQDEL